MKGRHHFPAEATSDAFSTLGLILNVISVGALGLGLAGLGTANLAITFAASLVALTSYAASLAILLLTENRFGESGR
jgi:hypothetical protein